MAAQQEFSFASQSLSNAYDTILVPLLFEPWAEHLLQTLQPEPSWSVLDLAAGTGIVAQKLAQRLAQPGCVVAADVSADMLSVARQRCASAANDVRFIESPAHPLQLDDATVDAVYCQQGFQFFPDKLAAAREIHRVLRPGGKVAVSVWCPVDECEFFGAICSVLRQCAQDDIAHTMSLPFDYMPQDELADSFSAARFRNVTIDKCRMDLVFTRGAEHACETVYATPIGPRLLALAPEKQTQIRDALLSEFAKYTSGGTTTAAMTSLVMTADK